MNQAASVPGAQMRAAPRISVESVLNTFKFDKHLAEVVVRERIHWPELHEAARTLFRCV
jgi:hypothetical protein